MSRTYKDMPWGQGGQRRKYWASEAGHAWFTRNCRRVARAKAKNDLRNGREPQPVYPVEREYFD